MKTTQSAIWETHWGNAALAREAAAWAQRTLGTEESRIWTGNDIDAIHCVGPSRLASLRELYETRFAQLRVERKEMFETPPGVGVFSQYE